MAKLGVPMIDTGPCTDPTYNFQSIATIIEAIGNPAPPQGPGPSDPDNPTGVPDITENYYPIYTNEDGDITQINQDGSTTVIRTAGPTFTKTYYLRVWGTAEVDPDTHTTATPFQLSAITVVESLTVKVPQTALLIQPNPPVSPLDVYNTPRLRTAGEEVVYARYNFNLGRWECDSLHNCVAHLRGRNEWDYTNQQVLGHDRDSNSIKWLAPQSIVVQLSLDIPARGKDEAEQLEWNSNAEEWRPMVPATFVDVHNLSQTAIEGDVQMLASLADGQYVLAWPDLAGLPGHVDGTAGVAEDTQIVHHIGGAVDYKVNGEECD